MRRLPSKSIDCFVCDLPFGQLATGKGGKLNDEKYGKGRMKAATEKCDWDVKLDLNEFWKQVKRLCKTDNTPVLMFCNTKFGFELYGSNPDWFRYDLVWNKERGVSFLLANRLPMKSHEMIYVFSKKGAFYKRVDIHGDFKPFKAPKEAKFCTRVVTNDPKTYKLTPKSSDGTTRCPLSVITIPKPNTLGHPTEKPLELYEWLLKRYCPEGGTVLDPTAGSFNACIAAKRLGLKAIGIEKDIGFFNAAIGKCWNLRASQTAASENPPLNVLLPAIPS
jgi:site-specific DNA-methyltransferase (adenine-specific)